MLTQLEAMLNSLVQPSEPLRSALWPPAFTGMAVGRVLPILRAAGCVTGKVGKSCVLTLQWLTLVSSCFWYLENR